jgi:ABC-type Fe3+ transport system permease subunit
VRGDPDSPGKLDHILSPGGLKDRDSEDTMADNPRATVLEIYKIAVEMADRTSARRAATNSFFLTLTTALAAVVGIVSAARSTPEQGTQPSFDPYGLFLTAIAGVVLAFVWWLLLRYYHERGRSQCLGCVDGKQR